jgi:hypothetical protein
MNVANADDFADWLRREESVSDNVRVVFLSPESGFGGLCAHPVQAGQELLSIPASLLMDRFAAMRSEIGPCLRSHAMWSDEEDSHSTARPRFAMNTAETGKGHSTAGIDASDSAPPPDAWAIILLLLHERARGRASHWHAYIAMLPPTIDAAATCFTAAEADVLLAGTALAPAARDAEEDLARLGAALNDLRARHPDVFAAADAAGEADPYGPDRLRWAHASFWSRALQVRRSAAAAAPAAPSRQCQRNMGRQ